MNPPGLSGILSDSFENTGIFSTSFMFFLDLSEFSRIFLGFLRFFRLSVSLRFSRIHPDFLSKFGWIFSYSFGSWIFWDFSVFSWIFFRLSPILSEYRRIVSYSFGFFLLDSQNLPDCRK